MVNVSWYSGFHATANARYPFFEEPETGSDTLDVSGGEDHTAAFPAGTVGCRLTTTENIHYKVGASATAATTNNILAAGGSIDLSAAEGQRLSALAV